MTTEQIILTPEQNIASLMEEHRVEIEVLEKEIRDLKAALTGEEEDHQITTERAIQADKIIGLLVEGGHYGILNTAEIKCVGDVLKRLEAAAALREQNAKTQIERAARVAKARAEFVPPVEVDGAV